MSKEEVQETSQTWLVILVKVFIMTMLKPIMMSFMELIVEIENDESLRMDW